MRAYLLIQTELALKSIASTLRAIPGIVSAEDVRGPYDAIAVASADSSEQTVREIAEEVRRLPGVIRALPAVLSADFRGAEVTSSR